MDFALCFLAPSFPPEFLKLLMLTQAYFTTMRSIRYLKKNAFIYYMYIPTKLKCTTGKLKGAYIKYVGVGARGFYKFFKRKIVAQETIDLNFSWPSNFFRKYFMVRLINFSFLFQAYS